MSKLSEHLASHHKVAAAHHAGMEKLHRSIAAVHSGLHKESGVTGDEDSPNAQLAAHHDGLADMHKAHAAHHSSMMEAYAKTVESDDLNKLLEKISEKIGDRLVPTQVSAVLPNRPGVTLVPRGGQQPVPVKPNVPLEFEKLVMVDEDEERIAG
jgi:hypothetical protein